MVSKIIKFFLKIIDIFPDLVDFASRKIGSPVEICW